MADREYHRLTRSRSRSIFGIISTSRSSLWLGKDHLLCIDTTGYNENYKRFYYRDIQALTFRKTDGWIVMAGVFALLAGGFGLIAVFGGDPIVAWVFGILAGICALVLILNLAAGPGCKCFLRTAVQTEELISLNRLRRARKALERLRPLIAEAQGVLAAEEIPARMRAWTGSSALEGQSPGGAPGFEVDDPNAPPRMVS